MGPGGEKLTIEGHEETFWGDETALNLNYGNAYIDTYICQNPPHSSLKCVHFIICKLYLNQVDFQKVIDSKVISPLL